MKTINHQFIDINHLSQFIHENSLDKYKQVLIQVFTEIFDEYYIQSIMKELSRKLPLCKVIGCTSAGEIYNGNILERSTTISFTIFEYTKVDVSIVDIRDCFFGEACGEIVADTLFCDDSKVCILFSTGINTITYLHRMLSSIQKINSKLIIAGGIAALNKDNIGYVFTADEMLQEGVVAAILSGEELQVFNEQSFCWDAIGKTMEITKMIDDRIYTLNHKNILDVYEEYFGEEVTNNLLDTSMQFPLIIKRNGIEIARGITAVNEDGSLSFLDDIHEGDKVQFGYGNVDFIVHRSQKIVQEFSKHYLESIFVYSCAFRKTILGEHVALETLPLQQIAATSGFFTYGEFFYINGVTEIVAASMTLIGLAEGSKQIDKLQPKDIVLDINIPESDGFTRIKTLSHFINKVTTELSDMNEALDKSNVQIRTLLNNANEGFLSFGKDLIVRSEYSLECKRIFDIEIENKNFCSIAYPIEEQRNLAVEILIKVFETKEEERRNIYISLLPEELHVNQKILTAQYKWVSEEHSLNPFMIAILTDITEKRKLEQKLQNEQQALKMVISVVADYSNFMQLIEEYKIFYNEYIQVYLQNNDNIDESFYNNVYREIHTFKGNFAQFGLLHTSQKLHELESKLQKILTEKDQNSSKLYDLFLGTPIIEWLDEDFNIIRSYLGEDFLRNKDIVQIEKKKLIEIEKDAENIFFTKEQKDLIKKIRRLRYLPFNKLIIGYTEYIQILSEKVDKKITALCIEGGNFLADLEPYRDISKALIHIFRNIIDHGIEYPEERIACDKSEQGNILCSIQKNDDWITIKICDDGCGIDTEVIKDKILEKDIVDKDSLLHMEENEIIEYIFHEGFSTKDEITDISGRGVGLSAVKASVIKIGGSISVETQLGIGTTFIIHLPICYE